jgi:hypothetical protein
MSPTVGSAENTGRSGTGLTFGTLRLAFAAGGDVAALGSCCAAINVSDNPNRFDFLVREAAVSGAQQFATTLDRKGLGIVSQSVFADSARHDEEDQALIRKLCDQRQAPWLRRLAE